MVEILKYLCYSLIMIPLIFVVSILSAVVMMISMTIALVFGVEIKIFEELIMRILELYNKILLTHKEGGLK